MANYAEIDNATETIIKSRRYDNFDPAAVAHKFGPLPLPTRIIPIVKGVDDVITNPLTQELAREEVITATEVTRRRAIVAMSQEDQDDAAEIEAIKAAASLIRDHSGTNAERLNRVETALFRLIKDKYS